MSRLFSYAPAVGYSPSMPVEGYVGPAHHLPCAGRLFIVRLWSEPPPPHLLGVKHGPPPSRF